jgi:peptidoglycan/LPS O-acetylase OafA/YrhL
MFVAPANAYPTDIRSLTSLRFIAALAILIFHYGQILPFRAGDHTGLVWKCHLGVDFFFILSGFVLSHVYLNAFSGASGPTLSFYIRRLARIYPLHLVTSALCALADILLWFCGWKGLPSYFTLNCFVINFLLLQSLGIYPGAILNGPSWSISAEWFAYLCFPFLIRGMARIRESACLLASLVLFFVLWAVVHVFSPKPLTEFTSDAGVLRIIPEFITGIALNRFGRKYALAWGGPGLMFACAAAIVILAHFSAPDIFIVPVFCVVILCAAEQARQGREGFLSRPAPVYLGEISYSLYMVQHLVLIYVFSEPLAAIFGHTVPAAIFYPAMFAMFPLTLALSMALYHFVEVPGRQWGRRFAIAAQPVTPLT